MQFLEADGELVRLDCLQNIISAFVSVINIVVISFLSETLKV